MPLVNAKMYLMKKLSIIVNLSLKRMIKQAFIKKKILKNWIKKHNRFLIYLNFKLPLIRLAL